jgi:hypothetical protein
MGKWPKTGSPEATVNHASHFGELDAVLVPFCLG